MTKAKEKENRSERGGAPLTEIESLLTSAEIKNIRDELERERALRVRALADFDNYRKRVERERGAAERSGKRAILLALLEVMDDFDRAIEHVDRSSGAPDAVAEGLRAIHKRLAEALKAQGVTPIESVGQQFDPTRHEAVGAIEAGASKSGIAIEPGAVTDEARRGYLWDGEVLRPASVRVAK
ncbi:MAG TPA: nucleotide exchange factor GrpE [Blastocatellia bacterium]|jgi:molecular chaperone GrpE|nr:nucleotide exchange factor GrpE [Blastocatellia bacterium]